MNEAGVERVGLIGSEPSCYEDGDDQAVDYTECTTAMEEGQYVKWEREEMGERERRDVTSDDTGHDDGDERLHDEIWTERAEPGDSDAWFGGSVGSSDGWSSSAPPPPPYVKSEKSPPRSGREGEKGRGPKREGGRSASHCESCSRERTLGPTAHDHLEKGMGVFSTG
jgi:hypothetical protein